MSVMEKSRTAHDLLMEKSPNRGRCTLRCLSSSCLSANTLPVLEIRFPEGAALWRLDPGEAGSCLSPRHGRRPLPTSPRLATSLPRPAPWPRLHLLWGQEGIGCLHLTERGVGVLVFSSMLFLTFLVYKMREGTEFQAPGEWRLKGVSDLYAPYAGTAGQGPGPHPSGSWSVIPNDNDLQSPQLRRLKGCSQKSSTCLTYTRPTA